MRRQLLVYMLIIAPIIDYFGSSNHATPRSKNKKIQSRLGWRGAVARWRPQSIQMNICDDKKASLYPSEGVSWPSVTFQDPATASNFHRCGFQRLERCLAFQRPRPAARWPIPGPTVPGGSERVPHEAAEMVQDWHSMAPCLG